MSDAARGQRVAGVAEALPTGERVLWEGAPNRALVARHVLHVRVVGLYFAAAVAWWAMRVAPSTPAARAIPMLALQLALGAVVLGLVYTYAAMTARATAYVVTSRRVVLRVGAVLPVVINLPLAQVTSAGVHRFRDGSGQIVLRMAPGVRPSWWLLWPHVRPGRLRWPEPLLRALPAADLAAAGAALQDAVAALDPAVAAPTAALDAPRANRGEAPAGHDVPGAALAA